MSGRRAGRFYHVSEVNVCLGKPVDGGGIGVRILCSKISELCYALILTIYANYAPEICHYASKLNNIFKSQTTGNDQPPSFSQYSMDSGLARVLLKFLEASSPESSTSSPSLETVVNLVPEATLSDRLLVLQPGSLCFFYIDSHETAHVQYARG